MWLLLNLHFCTKMDSLEKLMKDGFNYIFVKIQEFGILENTTLDIGLLTAAATSTKDRESLATI